MPHKGPVALPFKGPVAAPLPKKAKSAGAVMQSQRPGSAGSALKFEKPLPPVQGSGAKYEVGPEVRTDAWDMEQGNTEPEI